MGICYNKYAQNYIQIRLTAIKAPFYDGAFLIADHHHSAHKKVETNQAKEVFI